LYQKQSNQYCRWIKNIDANVFGLEVVRADSTVLHINDIDYNVECSNNDNDIRDIDEILDNRHDTIEGLNPGINVTNNLSTADRSNLDLLSSRNLCAKTSYL
jgi:hypothetical protein